MSKQVYCFLRIVLHCCDHVCYSRGRPQSPMLYDTLSTVCKVSTDYQPARPASAMDDLELRFAYIRQCARHALKHLCVRQSAHTSPALVCESDCFLTETACFSGRLLEGCKVDWCTDRNIIASTYIREQVSGDVSCARDPSLHLATATVLPESVPRADVHNGSTTPQT